MLRRSVLSLPQHLKLQFNRDWLNRFCSTENSSARTAGKSILDAAEPAANSAAHQALGAASETYMQRLQQEAAAVEGELQQKPSPLRRAFSLLFDAVGLSALGAAGFCGYLYYKYELEDLEADLKKLKAEELQPWTPKAAYAFAVERYLQTAKDVRAYVKNYTDPPLDRLLPDMAPEEVRAGVKTLVLDLENLLVHKEWTRGKGWQIFKRPGVTDFLYQMGHHFEVVIYTDETNMYAAPVIDRIDKFKMVRYRLHRSDTQYHNGKHVRDLSKLNRDLHNVLLVSANPDAWAFQPENTLKLKKWTSDPNDTTLLDLVPFLQMVASRGVSDVRDVVKAYDGEDDVVRAFKERVHKVAEQHKAASARGRLAGFFR